MPLDPPFEILEMPLDNLADAEALFEAGLKIARHPSRSRREKAARDLEDQFFRLGAIHPEFAPSFHQRFVRLRNEQLEVFAFKLSTWLYLMQDANDSCVEHLWTELEREPEMSVRLDMLAAICTPLALEKLAEFARQENLRDQLELMGFEIKDEAKAAVPRFTLWRRAIVKIDLPRFTPQRIAGRKIPLLRGLVDVRGVSHPINLPLEDIVEDPTAGAITWHYLSVSLAGLTGLPPMSVQRLHLVSPPIFIGWTVYCEILSDGKYRVRAVERDEEPDEEDEDELDKLLEDEAQSPTSKDIAQAELIPFDDELCYSNGHIYCTEGVVGEVGGPPIGLYPNPKCLDCRRPMFHLLTVQSDIRSYGHGWRSLFFCEDCKQVACNASSWN